jgi:hypothetical protein
MEAVGVSSGGTMPARSEAAPSARVPSPLPVDFRNALAKLNVERVPSGGHAGGAFDFDLYVTPAMKSTIFDPRVAIPPGTVLVMQEWARSTKDAPSVEGKVIYMMEKQAPGSASASGDWRYVAVSGDDVHDGAIDACARCHDEAPRDHVFPLPRSF